MPNDVITLSTFGMQDKWIHDKKSAKKLIDGQIEGIKSMKVSFDAAAIEIHRQPPRMILSALIIPQWKKDESYDSEAYKQAKEEYFSYLRDKCGEAGIELQDFYEEVATPDEKQYLHRLEALGSTADLIKNRAIINNQGNRHLQIDTNTMIVDKKAFYKETIGAERQQDGMNASYYDTSGLYVSPHNKVVYTSEHSVFSRHLALQHNRYVAETKDKLDRKTPGLNDIYSVCFTKACMDTGLVSYDRKYYEYWNQLWGCYPANLDHPTFQMTKHIVTAINMSWSQGDGKVDYCAALKGLKVPPTSTNDVILDFPSFSYLIKKYTNPKLSDETRSALLAISNQSYDEEAINRVVSYVIQQHDVSLLASLLRSIPDSDGGKIILKKLFDTFKTDLNFVRIIESPDINDQVTPEALQTLAQFIPEGEVALFENAKIKLIEKTNELFLLRSAALTDRIESIRENVGLSVKTKLDALGEPYLFTEEDKEAIFRSIDSLMSEDCMMDLTVDAFEDLALTFATNRLLNDKLKQQPAVLEALRDQNASIIDRIRGKIYPPTANEPFNRAEMDKIVDRIVRDLGFMKAQSVKDAFFKDPSVMEFIEYLNQLASIRPLDDRREVLIDAMAKALVTAVRAFDSTPEMPTDMGLYLKSHVDRVKQENSASIPGYHELLIRHRTDIEANISSIRSMKESLTEIKAKTPEETSGNTPGQRT